jgi:pimeloyl-ACP methyl ester carboxylesterase
MKLWPDFGFVSVLWALLRMLVFFYAVVLAVLFFFQEKIIFHPTTLAPDHQFKFKLSFEERRLDTGGERIHSLFFRPPGARNTFLYFHGNAGDLDSWGMAADELAERTGWNVWIVDYPGYGKSTGTVRSEQQLLTMAEDFYKEAEREFPSRVGVYGRSIGSGIAVKLASEHPVKALVLESPYYSLPSLGRELLPFAPTFLLRYRFPSYTWLPAVHAPTLIVHGEDDEVIPFAQGKKLAATLSTVKFKAVPGAHHNDLADFDVYWNALAAFLKEIQ